METLTCKCLGYDVFSGTLHNKLSQSTKLMINTINQYSYCMAEKDEDFKDALSHSDVLLPDGVGIVAAARFITGDEIKKISGADLHQHILEELNKNGGSCLYMGSSDETLEKIKSRIESEYPRIRAHFFSPPYKDEFSEQESNDMISFINDIHPDALFLGMTAPKQEKWAYKFKDRLDTNYICSIGAVFDFYAGTVKRPNQIWINMGMEWLGRMLNEPKRLYKRYLIYGPVFAFLLVKQKMATLKKQPYGIPLVK